MIKHGTYVYNYVESYIYSKFGDFSLEMSSGMPKEPGSLVCPLCAFLMRQNLHNNQIRPIS